MDRHEVKENPVDPGPNDYRVVEVILVTLPSYSVPVIGAGIIYSFYLAQ